MVVGEVEGKNRIDQATGANFATATTAPITQTTAALEFDDDFAVCYFVSEGPDTNDTFGTMEILNGGTWTAVEGTQRIGTNGAPPLSNVTVTCGWLNLTSTQGTQARLTGATSRLWTCAVVTWKAGLDTKAAISPSDFDDVEQIFAAHTPILDPEDAAYWFNPVDDQFEVYDKSDMTTRIGYWDGGDWITG